jgi:hypothetical protein
MIGLDKVVTVFSIDSKYLLTHRYEREDSMLDAYIIDQIRRREEERRRINERPALELPLPEPPPPRHRDEVEAESEPKRVVIIDL